VTVRSDPADRLPSAAWDRLQDVVARFEEAWQAGSRPSIAALLPPSGEEERRPLLIELVHVDLEYRLKAGEAARVESYLETFPELAGDGAAGQGLIAAEYELRRRREPGVTLAEYRRRFPELAPELERRFAADASAAPDTVVQSKPSPAAVRQEPPPRVAGYEFLGELGRGGMGVVFRARQTALGRVVALKMLPAAEWAGAEDLARLRTEAEALARLQHPHIVQVFEVGEQEGRAFVALEYLEGGSLAARLAAGPLPPREAAALAETLASAVHAAHEKHIVHRDLKPANVLLTADGTPKVSDFGLAKRLDTDSGLSRTGQIMGTPSYMPPEQAAGRVKEVGPASDVYSLGAILYELLTGRPPFRGPTLAETLRQVQYDEPAPPRRLQPGTPRDLETICLKCLEKRPERRYAAARDLADDLRRFLGGEPVRARPVGRVEKALKWARRRPLQALLAAVSVLAAAAVLVVAVGSLFYSKLQAAYDDSERQRKIAREAEGKAEAANGRTEEQKQKVEGLLELMRIERAHSAWREEDVTRTEQILADCSEARRNWEWRYLARLCRHDLLPVAGHPNGINSLVYSRDGTRMASASEDHTAKVWDAATGKLLRTLQQRMPISQAVFSPDGKRLATASYEDGVRVWDLEGRGEPLTIRPTMEAPKGQPPAPAQVWGVAFSPDGDRLAGASIAGAVFVWEAATGKELAAFRGPEYTTLRVAFSPDGASIAGAGGAQGVVRIWDAHNGDCKHTFKGAAPLDVCFSADGKRVAAACGDAVRAWDVQTGDLLLLGRGRTGGGGTSVAFSPDGERLACGGGDKVVRVWDLKTGVQAFTHVGHHFGVSAVAYSPDGARIASASGGIGPPGEIRVWDGAAGPECRTLVVPPGGAGELAFSRDGARLVGAAGPVWDAASGKQVGAFQPDDKPAGAFPPVPGARALSPNGALLARSTADGIEVWDLAAKRKTCILPRPVLNVTCLAFSPDGARLAVGGGKAAPFGPPGATTPDPLPGEVHVWDLSSGKEAVALQGPVFSVAKVAFSPDGRWIASGDAIAANRRGEGHVWDAATGERKADYGGLVTGAWSLAFSPDGGLLAAGSGSFNTPGQVKVWDMASGTEKFTGACRVMAQALAFTPDGTRLAVGDGFLFQAPGEVHLWDTATGQETFTLPGHAGAVVSLAFSPDGTRLASAGYEGGVKVWDASPLPGARPPQ
jgi:WD40 repeat protein